MSNYRAISRQEKNVSTFRETEPLNKTRKVAGYSYNYETMTKRPVYVEKMQHCERCGGSYPEGYDYMIHNTTGKCVPGKYKDN